MELTIREAAPLLGRSTRALRAKIARGELQATRRGRTWILTLDALPLSAAQRKRWQQKAEEVRRAAEVVLPSAAAVTRDRKHRSLVDFASFRGIGLLRAEIASARSAELPFEEPLAERMQRWLARAEVELGYAAHEFSPSLRIDPLRRARRLLSRAAVELARRSPTNEERLLRWLGYLEAELIPPIGGMLRWCERASAGRRAERGR